MKAGLCDGTKKKHNKRWRKYKLVNCTELTNSGYQVTYLRAKHPVKLQQIFSDSICKSTVDFDRNTGLGRLGEGFNH